MPDDDFPIVTARAQTIDFETYATPGINWRYEPYGVQAYDPYNAAARAMARPDRNQARDVDFFRQYREFHTAYNSTIRTTDLVDKYGFQEQVKQKKEQEPFTRTWVLAPTDILDCL